MLISKDNCGKTIGWRETYQSKGESVDVSVHRNVSTITTRDRNTGKVEVKTYVGKTPLPSDSRNAGFSATAIVPTAAQLAAKIA